MNDHGVVPKKPKATCRVGAPSDRRRARERHRTLLDGENAGAHRFAGAAKTAASSDLAPIVLFSIVPWFVTFVLVHSHPAFANAFVLLGMVS